MRTVAVLFLCLGVASIAGAQTASAPPGPALNRPDFLFGEPNGSVGIRGSWMFAHGGTACAEPQTCRDIYHFVEDRLTIDPADFNTGAFAADVGVGLTPRTDARFGIEVNRASLASEYRRLVDNNRRPIRQTTTLQQVDLSGGIRFALTPRGRRIGSLAWIPSRVIPFLGAGAGVVWYQLEQRGDFVDEQAPSLPIFTDTLQSQGFAPSVHVRGGVDVQLHGRWYLTLDGRYLWAAGDLGDDFQGFDPIDLAGFRFGAGINILF